MSDKRESSTDEKRALLSSSSLPSSIKKLSNSRGSQSQAESGGSAYGGAGGSSIRTDHISNLSSDEGMVYSPSYERIKVTTSYGEGDKPSCCTPTVRLMIAGLVFFMVVTTILAVLLALSITGSASSIGPTSVGKSEGGSESPEAATQKPSVELNKTLPLLACVFDYEDHAQKVLDSNAWNYFSSGATEEITLRDNVAAYRRLRIRPNREVDVSGAETSLTVSTFGGKLKVPIGFSPTASHWWAHKTGEIATARAAEALGTVMIVSIDSTTVTDEIAAAVPGALLWQQMYVFGVEKDTLAMIDLAERSGCKALVLTIDKPGETIRYAGLRGEIAYPDDYPGIPNYPPNMGEGSGYYKKRDWKEVTWLRNQTSLPVIVKGVLTAVEARKAIDHGASALLVSNHGGRALDGVPATIDQLAEVVAEVKGEVPVYIDGGIRSGIDVFKALALGADMVFVGRPVLWGLAYDGQRGVENVVNILTNELVNTMQLAGTNNLTVIDPKFVYQQSFAASTCGKV